MILNPIPRLRTALLALLFSLVAQPMMAGGGHDGEFDVSGTLFHHVLESHNWHIANIPLGDGEYLSIEVPLPYILYDSKRGLDVFLFTGEDAVNRALEEGYVVSHEQIYPVLREPVLVDGEPKPEYEAHLTRTEKGWVPAKGDHHIVKADNGKLYVVDHDTTLIDMSISKTPLHMLMVGLLMIWLFGRMAKFYKRNPNVAPKGVAAFLEPVVMFVENDIAKPNMQGKHARFMPYLLSLFFFIWFSNIFGLTPFASNIMGNIGVTAALAVLTLLITLFSANKEYYQHIFWFPGVPVPVKLILLPVELVGVFTRPFSLAIRLFANIAAGHFMILALVSLIFIVGKSGDSIGGAIAITPLSVLFTLFIMLVEVLVAAVQAYVFTLLTAVFIGQAMESHHHDDHAHDNAHDTAHA